MKKSLFDSILGRIPKGNHTVSLQGEGEPLTHPQFWTMAEQVVEAGFTPYTITNGSLIDVERMAALFPTVGFSLDTLDFAEAERIGRFDLKLVLQQFIALRHAMGPGRLVVHSVDYGQDLIQLRSFLSQFGLKQHVIQPLQTKNDYRQCYPGLLSQNTVVTPNAPCHYLTESKVRFFNIAGVELPCVYIKDTSNYRSIDDLCLEHYAHKVPKACEGCRELKGVTR